ncbi:BolA family protein [Microvirga sp. W0021]|uniref:BolA family protein n=1 Tax=Hohaiivirga grylli TaxID=3133970 RepID=A0ABV0BLD5_9HYPH
MPTTGKQSRKDWITEKLTAKFQPQHLVVTDDSQKHEGHSGWREGGETHYSIDIVSEAFKGKSRVEIHRMINDVLSEAFSSGLHALAVKAKAP